MLRVTVLELPARWNEVEAALGEVETLLAAAPPGDVVLLPEASLTGYVSPRGEFDLSRLAEPRGGATSRRLAGLAKRFRTHLVAPLIERDGARCFNTITGLSPDGVALFHYRKRHPWFPETWATPGDTPWPELRIADTAVTAAICFDVHFLPEEAAEVLARSEVLLFPSAWVEVEDSRPGLLCALAARFEIAVVNANWGVGAPRIPGQGRSMVIDASGAVRAVMGAGARRLDSVLP